ncbi:prepilin-type N-terminal cleavage/methylation domain-containing protein [Candidatus Kaiserbacteria bacterium]|nr:prepilin-type N-terminal cleavage/methylation domain-containing protein [Candidatus Kaiserbacteria bacterium]
MKKNVAERGYTLIELLIVTGIFVIVSGVVLANNARFGGMITLENFAYDVALSIRQAQVYSIAVQRVGSNDYGSAYGMHFDIGSSATYELFADTVTVNGLYDPGELLQVTNMNGGYRVSSLCVRASGAATETCGLSRLDVTFKRPEPDAYIRSDGVTTLHEAGRVVVISPRGETADIVIESTGQISIQ